MIRIEFALAPRLSDCFNNNVRNGRIKSKKYKSWIESAGREIVAQRPQILPLLPVKTPCKVVMMIPTRVGRDLDNRFKASLDLLVLMHILKDDSWPYVGVLTGRFSEALDKDRQIMEIHNHGEFDGTD